MQTISLFPHGALDPIEDKVDRAIRAILNLLEAGHPLVLAYSGGKDSSMVAALALHAAELYHAAGGKPLVVVTTGDTLVESPEVTEHYRAELARMRAFGRRYGLSVMTRVVQPAMAATFQVKVLSGRALPSFPGTHGDCSTDLKISPQRTFRRQLFRSLAGKGHAEPVTLLGTRYGESTRRNISMRERGESDTRPACNQDGDLVLSPVCHWQDDDIWEGIALYGAGARPSYSDFEDMRRIYAHAVGTSCAVVADASGAVWFIRRAWRNDKVDGAETQSQIDIIARLSEQFDKANARADLAEQRTDTAYKERNEAYREIGELKGTIAALTAEVRLLKESLDGKAA